MLGALHTEPSDYELFGLRLRSDILLPELFPAQRGGAPDVVIRAGRIDEPSTVPGLRVTENALLLTIPGVGRYRIRGGDEIVVDPETDAPERNVRLYLLGSAMGALLHQRGLLPLHANAIEIDGKAVAFMGESGAGKSTLAAWFHDRGYRIIADDVCVVGFDEFGVTHAAPGLPRLRLWKEALEAMGRGTNRLEHSYVSETFDKFDVPIAAEYARTSETVLSAIYLLDRADVFSVTRLSPLEAAEAVFANTYRGAYLEQVDGHRAHWSAAVELVRSVPIFRLARIWDINGLDQQAERVLFFARNQTNCES